MFQPLLHVLRLARIVEVAAAGGALHRQPADRSGRRRTAVVVEHAGTVARHRHAGGAGAGMVLVGGDEDVQHLGGADAVDQFDAGGLAPQRAGGRRQRLAGRDALAQRAALRRRDAARARRLGHRAVRGGRGEEHGGAELRDRLHQRVGRRLLEQHGGGADVHREQREPAQAEGEGERRAADEDVVGAWRAARAAGSSRHTAITSRWKCIVALGWPVVPEVKPKRAQSSAAVSTLANCTDWRCIAASSPSSAEASPKQRTWFSCGWASRRTARVRRAG